MANAVVTSDATKVKVDFGDLKTVVGRHISYFAKSSIIEVYISPSDGYCTIILTTHEKFRCSTNGADNTLIIDTIDGVAPANNIAIMDAIAGMMT